MALINGTSGNDSLVGTAADDTLIGGDGNDTLDGGAGNDSLDGGAGQDVFIAGAGSDVINGGANDFALGTDLVNYSSAPSAVSVDLTNTYTTGGVATSATKGGVDTLISIDGIELTAFNDTYVGSAGDDFVRDYGGNDSINGAGGYNIVDYLSVGSAINVDLTQSVGPQVTGGSGNDTLAGIVDVRGGSFDDVFLGNDADNSFRGRLGNDTLNGGAGSDRADYLSASGSVTVNLAAGSSSGADGNDLLISIERARGSNFNDTLIGSAENNRLDGRDGNDSLSGGDGEDTLDGGNGNDSLFGDAGNDSLLGGAGSDFLVGGSGNDTLIGGAILDRTNYTDLNSTSYASATSAVNVNLATGIVQDGMVGTDSLQDIPFVTGSNFDDTLTGSSTFNLFEQFEGGAGNDTINGGAIDVITGNNGNRASYAAAPAAVNVNLGTGVAQDGYGSTDSLTNINQVRGSTFADTLTGSDTTVYTEFFEGRAGNDTIDGKGGTDQVRYDPATSAVNVNLVTGVAQDGQGGTDTLLNIEGIRGSSFNDTLTGGNAANGTGATDGFEFFQGNAGNDTIDGGGGYDRVDYQSSTSGVNVTLGGTSNGTAQDGLGGVDTLINIEAVRGGDFNDTLTGSDSGVFESFEGRAGNDTIDGKGGVDRADYSGDWAAVNVNLSTGTANDGFGGVDTLLNIEAVRGSAFNDTLMGNAGDNHLSGRDGNDGLSAGDGNDTLDGGAGNDSLFGDAGNDVLTGGDGNDFLDGGNGADTFQGGAGNDYIVVGNGGDGANDQVDGGDGYDVVTYNFHNAAGPVNFTLTVASGSQTDTGGGVDTFVSIDESQAHGGAHADTLVGDAARNWLQGNGGNDTLTGGAGSDTFGFHTNQGPQGTDLITDAQVGDNLSFNQLGGTFSLQPVVLSGNDASTLMAGQVMVGTPSGGITTVYVGTDTVPGGDITVQLQGTFNASNFSVRNDSFGGWLDIVSVGGGGSPTAGADTLTGTAGPDSIDGLAGNDSISGLDGNDTLVGGDGHDTLNGGAGNDSLSGDAGDDWHFGGAGNDTISGGAGYDRVSYQNAAGGIVVNMSTGLVSNDGDGGQDSLTGIERVIGSAFNDSIVGSGADDDFSGNAGNDTLDGGTGGFDFVWYGNAPSAVQVDLQAGTATGGEGGDTLISIEGIAGSNLADSLAGSSGNNYFRGGGGADTIDGRGGFDTIDYRDDGAGVTINLATGTAIDGTGATDTLVSFEEARGSHHNDSITGSTNVYFERFEGQGGNDTINGGTITDTLNQENGNQVSYQRAGAAVTVNLATGTASGGAGNDVLININEVRGSAFNDTLVGSQRADNVTELFEGGAGDDSIDGGGGFDIVRFDGATGGVTASLATGTATGAGIGTDTFTNVEGLYGSSFNDSLVGGQAANGVIWTDGLSEIFRGGAGNDTIDGGQGYDRADYTTSAAGVTVTLNDTADGSANDGLGGADVLRNIEGVRGSSFNDTLIGSNTAAFESFEGREGNDSINGNGGVDRVDYFRSKAGVSVDLAANTASNDGYGGVDTLLNVEWVRGSRDYNDTIVGNASDNRLEGLGGADSLSGGEGNDSLLGGAGNDTLVGGAGFDTADYSGAGTPVSVILYGNQVFGVDSGNDSVSGVEHIIGTAGADLMYGDDGANRFEGGLGDDTLDGAGGDDTLVGGDGADLLNGLAGADSLDGGIGNDSLYGWADNDIVLAGEGNDALYGGAGADSLDGGSGADQLEGDDGADTLLGGSGADTLRGWNDNDSLDGGDDNDALFGGAGADTLLGGAGADQIEGDDGADSLLGGAGTDTLRGWNDNDTLDGGDDNDALYGGAGLDSLLGGLGNDVLEGDDGADSLLGGDGADTLRGWNDDDVLDGGAGADLLVGWSGNDSMLGGGGDDQLFGDDGADTLEGGAGGDVLQGGLGNDLYRFGADFGFDGVRDYDYIAGNNDTFHFSSHNIGDLSFARAGDALKVTHTANSANTIYVNDWYQAGSAGAFKIETWTMANGASFTAAQIEALVTP